MSYYEIASIAFIIYGVWMGFMEKRLSSMKEVLEVKLKKQEEINDLTTLELKEDVKRLEMKIDKLIELQLQRGE